MCVLHLASLVEPRTTTNNAPDVPVDARPYKIMFQ